MQTSPHTLSLCIGFLCTFLNVACVQDLDVLVDDDQNKLTEDFYSNENAYLQGLAKLYAGLAVSGQDGPDSSDIQGINPGFGQYLRGFWQLQELPTDEAIIAWQDPDLPNLNFGDWTANNVFVRAFYDRANFQVSMANEYLRQTANPKLDQRGVTAATREKIKTFRAEARFLRALSRYHLIDMFGDIALYTEDDPVTGYIPPKISRKEAFGIVVEELKAIESTMPAPKSNPYPRADRAAVWMLLSKLYLNAKVYTGQEQYSASITYSKKIMDAGYTLANDYSNLFLADNHSNGAQNEAIFSIAYDGINTQTFGGTTYLAHAPIGGSMNPRAFGVNGGWFGLRTTENLVNLFGPSTDQFTLLEYDNVLRLMTKDGDKLKVFDADGNLQYLGTEESNTNPNFDPQRVFRYNFLTGAVTNTSGAVVAVPAQATVVGNQPLWADQRAMFYADKQSLEIAESNNFSQGYGVQKWRNITTDLESGSDKTGNHSDIDFHMFRLGEVYLNYAEAVIRGGTGGSLGTAVQIINRLRQRAYGDAQGNITQGELTEAFLLDERARELFWEAHRRTDLIRFEKFTSGAFLWPFKNNSATGASLPAHFRLFPIPSTELVSNPNMKQNSGY